MQALRYLLGSLALATLLALLGCSGPAPGLNPIVSIAFSPVITADQALDLDATATTASGDSVTEVEWVEVPQTGSGETIGLFSSPTTLDTAWTVVDPAAITVPTQVTLILTVETLKEGKTVTPINVIVNPPAPEL
jgi:hypothetical protein